MIKNLVLIFILIFLNLNIVIGQYPVNVITCKFDSSGNIIWSKTGGGEAANIVEGITSDRNNNVYICGDVYQYIVFEQKILPMGIFTVKYSSSGILLWAKSITGGTMGCKSIITDSSENCYVMGRFSQVLSADDSTLNSSYNWDVFVVKYNINGNVVWLRSLCGSDWIIPEDIAINHQNNTLLVTGHFKKNLYFSNKTLTADGETDIFLAEYHCENGKFIKSRKYGGSGYSPLWYIDCGYGLAIDDANLFITGSYKNDSGYTDIFLVKKNINTFENEWERRFHGKWDNAGYAIILDKEKNIFITGMYSEPVNFGITSIEPQDGQDLFIAKFNNSGNPLWVKSAGSNISGYKGEDFGASIDFDHNNSIYVSGYVGSNAAFNGMSTVEEGPFIVKYDLNGNIKWAKSFYSGYDNNWSRGKGLISSDSQSNIYFATNFIDSIDITTSIHDNKSGLPNDFQLQQNYPNPFNPLTNITYSLHKSDFVTLKIYNVLGQEIQTLVNKFQKSCNYTIKFNAKNLSSGVYFYKLQVGDKITETKKMILMR